MKAYRQDFAAVAALLTAGTPADIALTDLTKEQHAGRVRRLRLNPRTGFDPALLVNLECVVRLPLYRELIPANPMPFVGRPKAAKTLPRSLPQPAVGALLEAVDRDHESNARTDWPERDLALILTGLLAGLRADELRRANIGDIRTATGSGAVIHVRGKGSKDRTVPIEADLLSVIEDYLDSRAIRLPTTHEIIYWARPFTLASERSAIRGP